MQNNVIFFSILVLSNSTVMTMNQKSSIPILKQLYSSPSSLPSIASSPTNSSATSPFGAINKAQDQKKGAETKKNQKTKDLYDIIPGVGQFPKVLWPIVVGYLTEQDLFPQVRKTRWAASWKQQELTAPEDRTVIISDDSVYAATFYDTEKHPKKQFVVTQSRADFKTRVWHASDGTFYGIHNGKDQWDPTSLETNPNRSLIVSSKNKTVQIWNKKTGTVTHTLPGNIGEVIAANFNSDFNTMVTISKNNIAHIWKSALPSEKNEKISLELQYTTLLLLLESYYSKEQDSVSLQDIAEKEKLDLQEMRYVFSEFKDPALLIKAYNITDAPNSTSSSLSSKSSSSSSSSSSSASCNQNGTYQNNTSTK